MPKPNQVTCSFTMDRDIYNAYKSAIVRRNKNVKNDLISYMMNVIKYDIPNAETIEAIEEVEKLKKDPNKKVYTSFSEILAELDNEI